MNIGPTLGFALNARIFAAVRSRRLATTYIIEDLVQGIGFKRILITALRMELQTSITWLQIRITTEFW